MKSKILSKILHILTRQKNPLWLIRFKTSPYSDQIHEEYYEGINMISAARALRRDKAKKGLDHLEIEEIERC